MFHSDNVAGLVEESPSQVRRYLNSVRDYDALRAWDNKQLRDKAEDGGVGDGQRGRQP